MAKLKKDLFGDAKFQELFEAHRKLSLDDFKRYLTGLVHHHSVSSNGKKMSFLQDVHVMHCKDRILQKVTNFFMAGEDLKILQVTKRN